MAALLCAAPVVAQNDLEPLPQTPGGGADARFTGRTAKEIAARIASACADKGWTPAEVTETSVVCSHEMGNTMVMLLAPRYATFSAKARFTILELDGAVRVRGVDTSYSTNAFGQTKEYPGLATDDMQAMLMAIGGKYPPGTTFKGNDLGIDGWMVRPKEAKWGFLVKSVRAGSAGATGGFEPEDVILAVNGTKFSNRDRFVSLIHKPKWGETITFQVSRNGEAVSVMVKAEGRAPLGEEDASAAPTAPFI